MIWPTHAPTPPVSTLVNSNNFTLSVLSVSFSIRKRFLVLTKALGISPSIYAVFQELYATHLCGTVRSSTYYNKKIVFNPDA